MIPSPMRWASVWRVLILLLLAPVLLAACSDNEGKKKTGLTGITGTSVTGTDLTLTISVNPNNANKGTTVGITVLTTTPRGIPIANKNVSLSTTGGTLASVFGQSDPAGKFVTTLKIPEDYNGVSPIVVSATVDLVTATAQIFLNDLGPLSIVPPGPVTMAPGDQQTFNCVGGVQPYSWEPSGGTINTAHQPQVIFTAGSAPGTFFLKCADSGGSSASVQITISLGAGGLDIQPNSATLAPGQSQFFRASGGRPPYTWSFPASAGTLSATTGSQVSLKLGTTPGPGPFTLLLTDSTGATKTATINVIAPAPPSLLPSTVTRTFGATGTKPGTCSSIGTVSITFTVTGGVPPYTFSATSGTVTPPTLGAPGTVTYSITPGTLVGGTTTSDNVTVLDSLGKSASSTVNIQCTPTS